VTWLDPRTLDRASPLPLWAQIVADLRVQMAAGAFDERFPTDEELTDAYGVSRQTAREAVRRLQAEGLVERHRGRGSTLTRPMLEQPLATLYSVSLTVSEHGLVDRNEIIAAERRPACGWVADGLHVKEGAPAVFLERLRFAGEEPLSLERSWLPSPLADGLLSADLEHGPLYVALRETCGVQITSGSERISPVIPASADRACLRMPARTAAFLVERLALSGAQPVELRQSTVRGDRYRFVAEWPARS
jgi:GntR family transcriptional regulator